MGRIYIYRARDVRDIMDIYICVREMLCMCTCICERYGAYIGLGTGGMSWIYTYVCMRDIVHIYIYM